MTGKPIGLLPALAAALAACGSAPENRASAANAAAPAANNTRAATGNATAPKPATPAAADAVSLAAWVRMIRFLLVLLIGALAACVTAPAATPPQPVYYVMRHLNTPAGDRDPDLTEEGRRQAALLADWFGGERPAAIYVSSFKRAQQTAAPLALRLGLTPIVYDPADTPGLLARLRAGPWPVLVVGHSNTVPEIIAGLGGSAPAPLSHEDFGDIWRIGPHGETDRRRLSP